MALAHKSPLPRAPITLFAISCLCVRPIAGGNSLSLNITYGTVKIFDIIIYIYCVYVYLHKIMIIIIILLIYIYVWIVYVWNKCNNEFRYSFAGAFECVQKDNSPSRSLSFRIINCDHRIMWQRLLRKGFNSTQKSCE